ncbi:NAD-dependent epimerase/dehydratase family protein [Roseivivax marinus]|uniref:NAD-dependent epimerase/dehydratase family protein n=1 Tax=Roseivivax marinus TaxID=1379903 RepID=UPI001F03ED60|nr:NAD-dependent epimerase/dehydratase family protein [Roseivivax marinus]UMA64378.1 NAD-dependent epimerase/dehydratase family protein [Roseivivax marinus]
MPIPTRVGLIGAGYIADWHAAALAATPGVEITAVCDPNADAARALADRHGARIFSALETLIESRACDAVHVLTPPHLHLDLGLRCLGAGLHTLIEKPVATSADEARQLAEAARAAGVRFHPGHNFLGLPSYLRLKRLVAEGALGRIAEADIRWALPFAPLRSGPYGIWPLREPKNLLFEIGPHLAAFAVDLFGPLDVQATVLSHPVKLPGGDPRPQGMRILARAGHVDVTLRLSLVETVDDRAVTLRGSSGRARLDYASDTLVVDRENTSDLILNPLRRQLDLVGQHLRAGVTNAAVQSRSLNRQSPYARSFRGMCAAIHGRADTPAPDPRFAADAAVHVMQALDDALAKLSPAELTPKAPAVRTRAPKPDALVIGGTGFIGRTLVRTLVAQGRDVRVLSRGRHGPFPDLPDRVETVSASLTDREALVAAMDGVREVYNLARALGSSWDDCLERDVRPAVTVAEAALEAGVARLVYTGTIASYDMSEPSATITETTGFGADMTDRNLYARSKAECEARLMALHRERGLPLTIARPGIVVGPGGPLQHWGIGRWHGAGAVRLWGRGDNRLPFVLNDDVADGLIRMAAHPGAAGEDFNLVGPPMLSARDYFDAIHARLGARIRVAPGNLTAFWAADAVKTALKRHALGRRDALRPSLRDWKSRAHLSPFADDKPREVLGWTPETDREAFLRRAVDEAGLFGF